MTLARAYDLLDASTAMNDGELKRAYRDMAKVWHPDRFTSDPRLHSRAEERLRQINEAYQLISDTRARRHTQPSQRADSPSPHGESPTPTPSTQPEPSTQLEPSTQPEPTPSPQPEPTPSPQPEPTPSPQPPPRGSRRAPLIAIILAGIVVITVVFEIVRSSDSDKRTANSPDTAKPTRPDRRIGPRADDPKQRPDNLNRIATCAILLNAFHHHRMVLRVQPSSTRAREDFNLALTELRDICPNDVPLLYRDSAPHGYAMDAGVSDDGTSAHASAGECEIILTSFNDEAEFFEQMPGSSLGRKSFEKALRELVTKCPDRVPKRWRGDVRCKILKLTFDGELEFFELMPSSSLGRRDFENALAALRETCPERVPAKWR